MRRCENGMPPVLQAVCCRCVRRIAGISGLQPAPDYKFDVGNHECEKFVTACAPAAPLSSNGIEVYCMNPTLRALNGFGLGARAGERPRLGDARGWLRAQLQGSAPILHAPAEGSPDAIAEAVRAFRMIGQAPISKEPRQRQARQRRRGSRRAGRRGESSSELWRPKAAPRSPSA